MVCFWRDLQIYLLHVDRQVSGGVFQTVARNVTVCKIRSSIIASNVRDMVVVQSIFVVCVELSPTAPLESELWVFSCDHHIIAGEDADRGHFDGTHAGDVANHRS